MNKIKHYLGRLPEYLKEWRWLFRYIRKYWLSVTAYILIGVIAVVMGLLVSVASKNLINAVVPLSTQQDTEQTAQADQTSQETETGLPASSETDTEVKQEGRMSERARKVVNAMMVVIGLAFGQVLFSAVASWITANVNSKITNEIRHEIFEKIMMSRWESLKA